MSSDDFSMDVPACHTPRLVLRPCALSDIPDMLTMHRDPEVMRFVGGPVTSRDAADELAEWIEQPCRSGLGYWTVVSKEDPWFYLGWIMLLPLDSEGPEIEIGWRFARHNWGQGFATESASRILRHGFEILELPEIVAVIHPENRTSKKLAKRIGFKSAGKRCCYGGKWPYFRMTRQAFFTKESCSFE